MGHNGDGYDDGTDSEACGGGDDDDDDDCDDDCFGRGSWWRG